MSLLRAFPPGAIVAVLLVLITSQVFFALLPYRRRGYIPVLVTTALGFGLGQLWEFLDLPAVRLGQADLLPSLLFALALQPLSRFVPTAARPSKAPSVPPPGSPPAHGR